jgi:ribosomal protein L44E
MKCDEKKKREKDIEDGDQASFENQMHDNFRRSKRWTRKSGGEIRMKRDGKRPPGCRAVARIFLRLRHCSKLEQRGRPSAVRWGRVEAGTVDS